jgi:16S rRNA (guanine527-N7)-methyltransferase
VLVHAGRAETLKMCFDCVTLRAVDRMDAAVSAGAALVRVGGWLAPMTTVGQVADLRAVAGAEFEWGDLLPLPGGDSRVLACGRRLGVTG